MQTILGANGVIATHIAKTLPVYTDKIRLVSRNPRRIHDTDEVMSADLLNQQQVDAAIKGSDVVYLAAGLTYDIRVWSDQWPRIMKNVIDGCQQHRAKLVFFDNVYCYGRVNGWMTEESPVNPCSKKGEVRAHIAQMILDEVAKGTLTALIARAPDFYGPHTPLSFLNVMMFERFAKRKSAQILVSDQYRHSFIYTPDAGKATAVLGNTPAAFNQVWHLPTDSNVLTLKQIAAFSATSFGVPAHYTVLKPWMIRLAGLFVGAIRESIEMLYQNDAEYLFSSAKFDRTFQFRITPYHEGIQETARSYKQ